MQESLLNYNSLDYEYNIAFISYDGFLIFEGQKLDYSNGTSSFTIVNELDSSGETSIEKTNEDLASSEISTEVSETSGGSLSVSII
jgi:hypothetical protein